jgi:hypothetical protein
MPHWLDPQPITRDDTTWSYRRTDTDHTFPVSITQIIGAVTLTDADRANIEAYRSSWEPRGNTVHACLESWLKTGIRPSADDCGDYADWVYPLIDHQVWKHCEVIASELTVCDMRQNSRPRANPAAASKTCAPSLVPEPAPSLTATASTPPATWRSGPTPARWCQKALSHRPA